MIELGKYYKSFKDNSIVKIIGFDSHNDPEVDCINEGSFGSTFHGVIFKDYFIPNTKYYEYKPYKAYDSPLWKTLNE